MHPFVRLACIAATFPLLAADWQYPAASRSTVFDVYHGVRVPDPYRWLENPDSPASRQWINQENSLTTSYLQKVPDAAELKRRLTELWSPVLYQGNGESAGFSLRNGRYFFLRRDPGQNQAVLYWMPNATAAPQVLLDPNSLSADGTAALLSWEISRDGRRLVYGIARAGSDWQDVRFRDVESGQDLPDKLEWIKFTPPEWAPDGTGVYYGRFPKPAEKDLLISANFNEQLCFHRLGHPQTLDRVVYQRPDHKDWNYQTQATEDGRYLVIQVNEGTRPENLILYQDLRSTGPIAEIVNKFEARYSFLGNRASQLYFLTTAQAAKGRIVSIDLADADKATEVLPQTDATLSQAVLAGSQLYAIYEKDVTSLVKRFNIEGQFQSEVSLPGKGHVQWAEHSDETPRQYFSFESFTEPETLFSFDPAESEPHPFGDSKLPFDSAEFETRQVFFPSKDGTRVPMFLIGRKGFTPTPATPCLLWGYGGFDVSVSPQYRPLYLQWIELGGIVASANLRGGDEYGEDWHQAGMKLKKQNVFDDFIAAAEWLIGNRYTSRDKLGIYGRSNGGLLIGAVLNQRPDLFGGAIAGVGVMDMLRFPKFTIGNAWTSDYGSPDNPQDFKALYAYSPLHNIRVGGHYPPTLILTSDHDDRVVPAHSFKYAATLQHAQAAPAPILIRIETSAGHGGGKPVAKQVDEAEAIIGFLEMSLHFPSPDANASKP